VYTLAGASAALRRPGAIERAPLDLVYCDPSAADVDGIARLIAEREGVTHEQAMERATRWFVLPLESNRTIVARSESTVLGYGRVGMVHLDDVPRGWYLSGVIVDENFRRRGNGLELTRRRLASITSAGAREAYYFVNSRNLARRSGRAMNAVTPAKRNTARYEDP
jgi:ribosomal protein S18 acetylase RimI-like enzyme